jgi:anti-sigma B factor antagonist
MDISLDVRVLSEKTAVLAVEGRLDAVHAPALRKRVRELIEEGHVEIVCDLTRVALLDSSGLAALVAGTEAARERGGFLKLAGLSEQCAETFTLTMLNRVFTVYPDVETALSS